MLHLLTKHPSLLPLVSGPLAAILFYLSPLDTILPNHALLVLSIIIWILIWWISEVVPIAVTALLPIILFPVFKITPLKQVTSYYSHPLVFLYLGGFLIAIAMQKWHLHKRIALHLIRITGTHITGIIAGFMLATAGLSMWMSNTATTVMMLPIALSIIDVLTQKNQLSPTQEKQIALGLLLAIAFSASIGGAATLVGTPPNAVFAAFMQENYNITVDFFRWMIIGVPFSLIMLSLCFGLVIFWFKLYRFDNMQHTQQIIQAQLKQLGPLTYEEKIVGVIFVTTAFLWMCKGILAIPLSDTAIVLATASSLFMLPSSQGTPYPLLVWQDTKELPWGILILFGGGLSMASALHSSGIVEIITNYITAQQFPFLILLIIITIMMVLLTECMSNLAITTLMLPIIASIALQANQSPIMLTSIATLAASCAFMLPMATPPNAVVFASGYIRIKDMIKIGFCMNILATTLLTILAYTYIPKIF